MPTPESVLLDTHAVLWWHNDGDRLSAPARAAIDGAASGDREGFHGDPADRLIYATALLGRLPLVTKDQRLRDAAAERGDVTTIW